MSYNRTILTDTNKLTVTISQKFLDSATYPIKVDPTFGYTTLGSSSITLDDSIVGRAAQPDDEHGIVNSLHAGLGTCWTSGDKIKMALYNLKGNLISPQSVERDQGQDVVQFVHLPIDATPAKCAIRKTDYVIAWWSDLSVPMQRDSGTSGDSRYYDTSYGSWPDNINWNLSSYIYSTYAMYEFENYNDWLYSEEIGIDTENVEINNDVFNVPVLIRLNNENFDFSQAQSDGSDIRFSLSNGAKLYYARERWDSTNEVAELWVNIDKVYGYNTTTIKMYWGNNDAPDTSMPKAVFNSSNDLEGVWHLDEGSGSTASDETDNNFNGTYNGNLPDQKDGVIYKSQDFDGSGDYISLPDNCSVTTEWTLAFWVKPNSPDNYERIFIQGEDACATKQIVAYWINGHIEFCWADSGTGTPDIASGSIPDGEWSHVVWTYDGTTHNVYVNGVSSTGTIQGSNIGAGGDNYIGCREGTQNYWTGELDEVWIISNNRSASWAKLLYETQKPDQLDIVKFKGVREPCLWTETPTGGGIYRETGNVGIGKNNPGAILDVQGPSGLDPIPTNRIRGSVKNLSAEDPINDPRLFQIADSRDVDKGVGGRIAFEGKYLDTPQGRYIGYGVIGCGKENNIHSENGGYMFFGTRENEKLIEEKMRLDPDGNLGIGTSYPWTKLNIQGNGNLAVLWGEYYPHLTIGVVEGPLEGDGEPVFLGSSRIGIASDGSIMHNALLNSLVITSDKTALQLGTGDSGDPSARLTITPEGKIGIGTIDPSDTLTIKDGDLMIRTDGTPNLPGVKLSAGGDAGAVSLFSGGFEMIRIDGLPSNPTFFNAGNVGIGIAEPETKLQINGPGNTVLIKGTNDPEFRIEEYNVDVLRGRGRIGVASAYNSIVKDSIPRAFVFSNNTGAVQFGTSDSDPETFAYVALTITEDRYVGIGTTIPSVKLEVDGNTKINGQLNMNSNKIVNLTDPTDNQDAATKKYVLDTISGTGGGWTRTGTNVHLTIETDKVGIGTTSPTAKLDVDPGTVSRDNPNIRFRGTSSMLPSSAYGEDGDFTIYHDGGSVVRLLIKVDGYWYMTSNLGCLS